MGFDYGFKVRCSQGKLPLVQRFRSGCWVGLQSLSNRYPNPCMKACGQGQFLMISLVQALRQFRHKKFKRANDLCQPSAQGKHI